MRPRTACMAADQFQQLRTAAEIRSAGDFAVLFVQCTALRTTIPHARPALSLINVVDCGRKVLQPTHKMSLLYGTVSHACQGAYLYYLSASN